MKRNRVKRDRVLQERQERFRAVADPIVGHPAYQQMQSIGHHSTSVYAHSISVAYHAYLIAARLGLDERSTIRGALLHDFYLYKFSQERKQGRPGFLLTDALRHMVRHPRQALKNAEENFSLNARERDIIASHMFPAGMPRTREALVVSLVDKCLAVYEYTLNFSSALEDSYELRFRYLTA